jgi:salicylate 5-hydroxylase small subunit
MPTQRLGAVDYTDLCQLYAAYASSADAGNWEAWLTLFSDDCDYRLVPRENHERGLPLATLAFKGQGMLKDRIYAIRETLFHDPYYQRHVIGPPLVLSVEGDTIRCEANYAVFRTKLSQLTSVYNVGRYVDTVQRSSAGLRFTSKLCVYDSELIPNSIIYPV